MVVVGAEVVVDAEVEVVEALAALGAFALGATEVVVATPVGELTVFHQNVEAGGVVPPLGSEVTISWSPDATFVVESNGEGSLE